MTDTSNSAFPVNSPRVQSLAQAANLTAIIASSPANVQYLTGYDTSLLRLLPTISMWAVWAGSTPLPALIVPAIRVPSVLESGFPGLIVPYGRSPFVIGAEDHSELATRVSEFIRDATETPLQAILRALVYLDSDTGDVGVDETSMSPSFRAELSALLTGRMLHPAQSILLAMRAKKTSLEVAAMARALDIVERAMGEVLAGIVAGHSEAEVNRDFRSRVARQGGHFGAGAICIGPRSGAVLPPSEQIRAYEGEAVKWDVAAHVGGYWADTARTGHVGFAVPQALRMYGAIQEAHERLLEAVKPGVAAAELYSLARRVMIDTGFQAPQMHVGHGIGLDLYEPPLLGPTDQMVLEEGMVLCIENPVFEIGQGAMTIEDTVLVLPERSRVLNHTERNLIRL